MNARRFVISVVVALSVTNGSCAVVVPSTTLDREKNQALAGKAAALQAVEECRARVEALSEQVKACLQDLEEECAKLQGEQENQEKGKADQK